MAKLTYLMIQSLDGYIEDEHGNFDWAMPDEQVHAFVNNLMRPVGIYLFGRRMYEVMTAWETMHEVPNQPQVIYDFAEMWQSAEKIVFSSTLDRVSTAKTRLVRQFDPESIRELKAAAQNDIGIGGPHLAAQAFEAGLVDECHLFLVPIMVGGGKPSLPVNLRLPLELLDTHRFENGMLFLKYRVL